MTEIVADANNPSIPPEKDAESETGLKACPFCGYKPRKAGEFQIVCDRCDFAFKKRGWNDRPLEEMWNRRATYR